jgi:hypothetical protein
VGDEEIVMRTRITFYAAFAFAAILLAIAGFGPSLVDQTHRNAPLTALAAAHGVATALWLLLFAVQATLVAHGRVSRHRALGMASAALAVLVLLFGFLILRELAHRGYDLSGDIMRALSRTGNTSRDPARLVFPLAELAEFGALVGAAIWFRRRAEVHKRLMLLAVVVLLNEPVLHLVGYLSVHWPVMRGAAVPVGIPVTVLLLSTSGVIDRVTRGRVHPVSLWVPVFLFVLQNVLAVVVLRSAVWHRLATVVFF